MVLPNNPAGIDEVLMAPIISESEYKSLDNIPL